MSNDAATLNSDCHSATVDFAALQRAMRAQGATWHALVTERCPHLFATVPVFVTAAQMQQMREVVEAVERVVKLPAWMDSKELPLPQPLPRKEREATLGVFFGYDFHLNDDGAHLIEINSNAGGGFLNSLLLDSQRNAGWPGTPATEANLDQMFLEMFRNDWQLARGDTPLQHNRHRG